MHILCPFYQELCCVVHIQSTFLTKQLKKELCLLARKYELIIKLIPWIIVSESYFYLFIFLCSAYFAERREWMLLHPLIHSPNRLPQPKPGWIQVGVRNFCHASHTGAGAQGLDISSTAFWGSRQRARIANGISGEKSQCPCGLLSSQNGGLPISKPLGLVNEAVIIIYVKYAC